MTEGTANHTSCVFFCLFMSSSPLGSAWIVSTSQPPNERGQLLQNNYLFKSSIDVPRLTSKRYNFLFFSFPYRVEYFWSKGKLGPWADAQRARSRWIRKYCWVWMGSGVRSSMLSINHSKLLWQPRGVWVIWNMSLENTDWSLWAYESRKMYIFRCFLTQQRNRQLVIWTGWQLYPPFIILYGEMQCTEDTLQILFTSYLSGRMLVGSVWVVVEVVNIYL